MYLVIVLAACLQDKAAEEAFKKIEETVRQAKTLSVSIKYASGLKAGAKENWTDGVVTLLLKDGNKVSLRCEASHLGREIHDTIVSDGSKTAVTQGGDSDNQTETTSNKLRENLTIALARVGGAYAARLTRRLAADQLNELPDYDKTLALADYKTTEDDGDAKTLTYKVTVTDTSVRLRVTLEIKVWYIARTSKILKRVFKLTGEPDERTVTETYEEFYLNTDIPDEKFKVRDGK